jgi:hypothetical protein
MLRLRRHSLGILILALAAGAAAPVAHAKVVGLVFDDSGSMLRSYHLPLLGAQLLASSLDGRPSRDRFFAIRLSKFRDRFENSDRSTRFTYMPMLPGGLRSSDIGPDTIDRLVAVAPDLVERLDITPGEPLQRTIAAIRNWPIDVTTPTPYEPVEMMLDKLARETNVGEDAHLVIISDGSFYDDAAGMMASRERLRANYAVWQQRMKGPLTVHFLLIKNGPTEDRRNELQRQVDRQGVVAGLIGTFVPLSRSYSVDGFEDLTNTMIEIMARISATDRDRASAIVRRIGDTVELNVPFSISRIITAGIAEDPNRAARPTGIEGGIRPAGRIDAGVAMARPDTLARWPRTRLVGDVSQFLFDEALPRGRHIIRFDGTVGGNVEVLFRSDISLGWSLRDSENRTLFRSRDVEQGSIGTPTPAPIGRPLRIDVDVFDRLAKQMAELSGFPQDAIVELMVRDPNGRDRQPQRLGLAPDRSAFTAPITFGQVGDYAISVRMRLPGFVTTETAAINVRAHDRFVDFTIGVDPQGETGRDFRKDDDIDVLTPKAGRGPAGSLARVRITPSGGQTGELDLSVTGLPPGLEARLDGTAITPGGARHTFQAERPISIDLHRTAQFTGIAQRAIERSEISVAVRAREPHEGAGLKVLRIEPVADPPRFELLSANAVIQLEELEEGRKPLEFRYRDDVRGPLTDNAVSLRLAGPWPVARIVTDRLTDAGGGLYRTAPVVKFPRWPACCLIGLFGLGDYRLDIDAGPALNGQMPFRIEDRDQWTRWYCWAAVLLVLLVFYFVGFLWYRLTAVHFPARASLMFERNGGNMPDREPLRRNFNWTSLRALAWPYYLALRKTIRQRFTRSELDLVFEAVTRESTLVWPRGDSWPPFTLNGQSLAAQGGGEGRPIEPLEMNYGDPFGDSLVEQRQEGLVVTLVKEHENFPGYWSRFRTKRGDYRRA